jgi:hypothetical protein
MFVHIAKLSSIFKLLQFEVQKPRFRFENASLNSTKLFLNKTSGFSSEAADYFYHFQLLPWS